jgi:hypothetical protein
MLTRCACPSCYWEGEHEPGCLVHDPDCVVAAYEDGGLPPCSCGLRERRRAQREHAGMLPPSEP